jgi:tryptophanyl-tRNA synthetase
MTELRAAVGLRSLHAQSSISVAKTVKTSIANFKQYREKDGKFYFKLVGLDGGVLLQSLGFESPKMAGECIGLLRQQGSNALTSLGDRLEPIPQARQEELIAALRSLVEAQHNR